MKNKIILSSILNIFLIFIIFSLNIPKIESALKCAPDYKSKGDNYFSVNDPQDNFEYFYGYEFAHKVGDEYYDQWKGVYWDNEQFCYDAYDNFTRPDSLTDAYEISQYEVVNKLEDVQNPDSYILIEHDQSNLVNFHKKMCMTKTHNITNYNHGEHELLIKMDKLFEKDFLNKPYHFYFTIENPSNDTITFSFKTRNFVNTTEFMNDTLYDWGPNTSQCVEEEITEAPTEEKITEAPTEEDKVTTDAIIPPDINESDTSLENPDTDFGTDEDTIIVTDTVKQTTEPCERDWIIINETLLEWTEEYPIPEVFYFTNNYTIEPHKSIIVNISLSFEKNKNATEGGYFIISEETGKSKEPFYWPEFVDNNGKIDKLTNMEIILESDFPLGVSSFSLMRRRDLEKESYLGKKCNVKNRENVFNGRCGDGYSCNKDVNGTECRRCKKKQCKQCDTSLNKCTECFMISVDGQWNPSGGKGTDLKCDLDYIDITKVIINDEKRIEVPPAIHWRVTMDFWIWISDTSVLSDAEINMNIVYKDFIAMTLRCFPEGLRIYATPLEWLYEYPTYSPDDQSEDYYTNNVEKYKRGNIVDFLTKIVGSYDKVTKVDLIKNATSNWVYIRYAFNLDSSKHYLNDLPESNLKVAQVYTEQTAMPFHMKKFYGRNDMTYLYFHNFYHPLKDQQYADKKNITIYIRNLNIFREYIPQNIITKYYNLHLISEPKKFPQLLVSFPFSNLVLKSTDVYQMKGYNYYIRDTNGYVINTRREEKDYDLKLDSDIITLKPPRNFWRLMFLDLNKQPETCDLVPLIPLKCDPPSEVCFEDDKAFICQEGTDKPYYLDINKFECKNYCSVGYMHPPRYDDYEQRLYCSYYCDTGNKQCPSDNYKYTDIHSNFLCSNDFFNIYYKCFSQKESLNNAEFTGIFFSDFLRTPTIYIEFPEYRQFAIDFWYFPDDRFRNKRYLDPRNNNELKNPKQYTTPATEKERIIFLSDCCKVVYGTGKSVLTFYVGTSPTAGAEIDSRMISYNWNHFVLTYFLRVDSSKPTFYLTFTNTHYYECGGEYNNIKINYGHWGAPSNVKLSKIVFCNKDTQNSKLSGILKTQCQTAQWLDGFYRRLQIFDLKYSNKLSVFSSHQYEDDGLNGMLKHRYIYGLNSIIDNRLLDYIGNAHGNVPFVFDTYSGSQNPDKASYILYETNFAPQGGIANWGGIQYVENYDYTSPPELDIRRYRQSCSNKNCKICQKSDKCLACKEGFSLFSQGCKGDVNYPEQTAPYFYKNPGKNMPDRLSLKLDFDKIINEPYFTFFFFIKIYGFVKDAPEEGPVKLLIFHQEREDGVMKDKFYLAWEPDRNYKEKIFFYVDGTIMFEYSYFRENYFGLWIPVSFTAFREEDRRFKMNMAQASILYENLERKRYSGTDTFPYIKFTQFTITNKWVGLLSDVKIFNKFIINAWGIIKHENESPDTESDDTPDSAIEEINLKSDSSDSCLKSSQILNQPASGYKVECVNDYNPHWYKHCSSMEAQTVRYHQGDGYRELCGACCNSWSTPVRCLGGRDVCGGGDDDTHSCENKTPIWKTYYVTFSKNKAICYHLWYIDYNRFKYARAHNVESPQDVWAIDFWFKTSTNQAVKENGLNNAFTDKSNNNNNFVEFEIDWNYHIKLRVFKETVSEKDSRFTYKVECTPIVVLEHQDLTTTETILTDLGDRHYRWTYIACGVNFQEKLFYMTNNTQFQGETSFTSKLELIPSEKTTLSITEKSRTGYGFTIIYQLRLWHCYNCAHAFRNLDYQKDDKNFNAVYHNFDGSGVSASAGQAFGDQAGRAKGETMYQAADFPGYTFNYGPGEPVLCDETLYEYYNQEHDKCERHYNLARTPKDYSINIPSSRNARYTMEFWFFVENSAELSPGFNLLWDYHLSITLLRDTSNKNTINAICFPQSYRDNVDKKGGQDIIDLYDNALNKDKYAFYQGSSMWNFVRCAVDQTRKIFYINDNLELILEGEVLYGTQRNYRPFRYFKINAEHELKFQNAVDNPTRIFVRNIKCYRDFIDFRLMELKYKVCGNDTVPNGYWGDCEFYPLSFCFDYGEYVNPAWPCTNARSCFSGTRCNYCGLVYHKFPEDDDNVLGTVIREHWQYLLKEDVDQYYPTFPDIYLPNFCLHGVAGGDKEYCTGGAEPCHLRNNSALFWPNSPNMYIDLDTLTQINNCKDIKSCRLPDTWERKNYCIFKELKNNMVNCQYSNPTKPLYYDNFVCTEGYVRVYYECIEPEKIPKSAMYFSNVYSFPNVIFSPANKAIENDPYQDWKTETRLASYYIEVWMKFDALNYRKEITEIEYYLYAHPHQIIKDPADQKYKYSNKLISQGSYYYTLTSMNSYEWNKIIIENIYDPKTEQFHIKFYLNYEFDNPEFSIPNLDSSIYKLHFRGFGFCDKTDSYCRVNDDPVYLRWGVAWYRNFRVWDADITSLQSIQACEYGYTQLINAQKYYFSLTADTIIKNTIVDRIDPDNNKMVLNYWVYHTLNTYKEAFDNAMRENYSTDNFDKTYMNENNYISGINEDGTDYLISSCAKECKRCYSSANTDCYECRTGYSIYGKQCKVRTGYFLKTPPDYTEIREIVFTITDDGNYFDLKTYNPITITLYIKFFGIELDKVKQNPHKYWILVCFYKDDSDNCLTFIGYNYDDKTIVFVVNNVERYASKAKNYVGIWTHFGISIHRRDSIYFPNMLNFMIDQEELIPIPPFDPTEEIVNINIFSIRTEPICYYSSFKVFSTFYYGPYGHVNAIASTRGSKLIYQLALYGSSNINCITDANLAMEGVNIKTLLPVCVPDYLPYEDSNNICSDDSHFMDVIYKVSPPCELCDTQCITNCYGLESRECTCDYYEGLYWVKTDEDYQLYECQRVDSINFAFYDTVEIKGLNVVTNDEMSIAFWLDIYEYRDNNFESLEIIWNQHLAVIITGNGEQDDNKFLKIVCHSDYDINNPDMEHTKVSYENVLKFNRWNYIRCQVDKFHNLTRINDIEDHSYQKVTYSEKIRTSTLIIRDTTTNFNYGFSFVRELKLFSSYNFDFWEQSNINIKKENFGYLLHHFHNDFTQTKLEDAKIVDEVEGQVIKLEKLVKPGRIGYNYVIDYEYLVICEEGYVYNEDSKRCDIFDTPKCIVPRTKEESCLLCNSNEPYLKDDDQCYSDCSPNYFADNYFKQCRKCEATCYTCFGKYYTNCLSCIDPFYYIASLHRCVENCQEFGLVESNKTKNTCEELITSSYITEPVYLNNSYDYNPSNEDFVSKIINRDIFNKIVGHLKDVSNVVKTKWKYDRAATLELNKNYRYFKLEDIPDIDPITSDPNELTIEVNNDYFKYGYNYIFCLEIYSENGIFSTTHTHNYTLMMNDYPRVGPINILPAEGYITNLFLITINKCTDDVSDKNLLLYKFSYFKKKADIIFGYNDESPEEIVIRNFSKNSEILFKFPELNPEENNTYYIRGYCKDEYNLYYSEIQKVRVVDIPTKSGVNNITLSETIQTIDIDEELESEQLLNRAEFLATTTVDFEKEEVTINRTKITTYNKQGVLLENLQKTDPSSSMNDIYCNYRGDSYVVYFYLICDCHGYDGAMCQIDHGSYDFMIDTYNQLFLKVKMMQTGKYNNDLIKSVNLLMSSGAAFMEIDNMDFMLESIEFINLYRNKFTSEMMDGKNYELYFDVYNSLIEYGLSIVNKLKYKNFISKNSKNSDGLYNAEKFRNATLAKGEPKIVQDYFNKIKASLQNLLEFYASNKKELRFINKNINVYVALINENFEFDTYFDDEKKLYEPYINFQQCLEKTMIQSQGNPSYRVYLSAIVWKVTPFMSDEKLYFNTTSPVISFKFLDYDTGEKIYLSDCGTADNQIQLYFPVNNYNLVDRIKEKKEFLSPENQYGLDDDIFCDPVYINASGAVFNSTPEERRQKYFVGFNFSCEYYKVPAEDQTNIKLTKETLDYHKYTKENYIQCLTNKLVQESYGEFVVDSYLIPENFHINSRFFYLKHYKLLSWSDNYKENQAFYFFVVLGIAYAGLSLVYIYFEKYYYVNKQRMNELKKEIAKINLPYRDEYIFNNDLQIEEEIQGKFKDKRKPNNEEMNLDTNNIDISIMADEISKYNKGFKSKENALGFTPEYFGIKPKKAQIVNSKYFPGEVDVRKRPDNDDEISPEKFEKMKNFYNVGFKGLSSKENAQKEMQLSKDKRKILIKKKENLRKIEEIDEDENDIEIADKDFFNEEEDEYDDGSEKEKETTLHRRTRNFKGNMSKYRDFVSTSEQYDTESNLKSSKRETATKKFFGSNPPKKGGTNRKINSLVFTEKEQQKIGKKNSAFFGQDNLEIDTKNIKNKRKQKNIFQNDYDDLYKPGFKKPKVVSENLGFFTSETIDFEQDMDNENKNPPYFGNKFRKVKGKNKEDKTQGLNAGIRMGFYYKNRQIDLNDSEEALPDLAQNLTFEKKMEEFHGYSISFKGFLIKNIKSRYILLTTFDRMSIVYERYMRAGNFAAQLAMFAFFLSIFFTNDANQVLFVSKAKSQITNFIIYCLCSEIFGCLAAHLPAYCFWVNDKKFRKLYTTIRLDGGINVLKQTEDIIKKGRLFWIILGIIIQVTYIVIGFYFAFGFCATYYYQRSTYFFALICTIGFDFLVAEFVWEIIIGLLFYIRECGRIIVFFGTLFNTLRNIKHLV